MSESAPTRGRIHQLPPSVADAIAAGEVVERPASVVKELVENALDAGARRVTIEVEGGGLERIAVADDGLGIAAEELALAFSRHATSKIDTVGDLARISTLGFRGEALASIGAVAAVEAVSRPAGVGAAARVTVRGAVVTGPGPAPGAPGTAVTVRDLFGTTPARRAFLRQPRAEAAACVRVAAEAALARPDVAVEVRSEGRRSLTTPGSGQLRDAVRAVFGAAAAQGCRPVELEHEGLRVTGLVGSPAVARASREACVLLVNGRRVHQRGLQVAVENAFRGLLPAGRYPLAVLDVRCDPSRVDVNVHPTKREVRFTDERVAFAAVERACWAAVRGSEPFHLALASGLSPGGKELAALGPPAAWAAAPLPLPAPGASPGTGPGFREEGAAPPPRPLGLEEARHWRPLGQALDQYLVVETGSGVAILDQHAAHEKVLYWGFLEGLRIAEEAAPAAAPAPSQVLLMPDLIDLPPQLVAAFPTQASLLAGVGFDLELFGETSLRCTAVPAGLPAARVAALVEALLAEGLATGALSASERHHRLAAVLACHAAVRFGDRLSPEGIRRLLDDLADTPGGLTCPHGRPTVLLLGDRELRHAFGRS